jgi:hypothetical protein
MKARWLTAFDRATTKSGDFHGRSGTMRTPHMHDTQTVAYLDLRGFHAISMP